MIYWIKGTPPLERIQHIEIKELVDLSHQTDQRHRAWDTQAGELIWPGRPDERDWFKAKALCQLAYKIYIWILNNSKILFKSPFVQAGYSRSIGFLAYAVLRPLSLAYAPRKIVDRKALLRTNDGPFSLPFSSPTSVLCWLEWIPSLFFFVCESYSEDDPPVDLDSNG